MSVNTNDIQSVMNRIEKLERQNRRLRGAGIVAILACGAAVLMGQAPATQPARPAAPRVLDAERIILRDLAGGVKATLLNMPGDMGVFEIRGEEGRARSALKVTPGGDALLELSDKNGFVRAVLAVSADGNGTFELKDKDGKTTFKAPEGAARPAPPTAPATAPAPAPK